MNFKKMLNSEIDRSGVPKMFSIKQFGKGFFDVIHGHEEDVPKKPDPAGVYAILKELQIDVKDTLYIGDTNTDMDTGKGAGAFTIGVLWGFRKRDELEQHHADAIIEKPTNILDYVN